jgi:hypothetical protein
VPLVGFLSHDSCNESGEIFEVNFYLFKIKVGGGFIAKLRW